MSTPTSSAPAASSTVPAAASLANVSLQGFVTSLLAAIVIFAAQMLVFEFIRNKIKRIYSPKTYLVPEKELTNPPPVVPFGWVKTIFNYRDREVISKCGLDAYFFLRYLQTMLIIFVPLLLLIFPILLPLNFMDGRDTKHITTISNGEPTTVRANVTGLDTLAWGNVQPKNVDRYWGHLILALIVIIWVCGVTFSELRIYIRIRQDYLTSAEHRIRASATTILVSAIPKKWLTLEALEGLYDVFPGGVRNIWINRDYNWLLKKVRERGSYLSALESAETHMIRLCNKANAKKIAQEAKKNGSKDGSQKLTKEEKELRAKEVDAQAAREARGNEGISSGDAYVARQQTGEADPAVQSNGTNRGAFLKMLPLFSKGVVGVGEGLGRGVEALGAQFGKVGDTMFDGIKTVGKDFDNQLETTNGFVTLDESTPSLVAPTRRTEQAVPSDDVVLNDSLQQNADNTLDHKTAQNPQQHALFGQSPAIDSPGRSQFGHGRMDSESSLRHNATSHSGTEGAFAAAPRDPTDKAWWKFWLVPAGGYASPVPHGFNNRDEYPFEPVPEREGEEEPASPRPRPPTLVQRIKILLRLMSVEDLPSLNEFELEYYNYYPEGYKRDYEEEINSDALWKEYIKPNERPRMRVANFAWLPPLIKILPGLSYNVDTIIYCRGLLLRMNESIHHDQTHQNDFPLMNSAFIQFNHQVAAHMAAQAASHHVPRQMAPRTVEISPKDVIWKNMAIKWWEAWLRTGVVVAVVTTMTVLWAIPIAATALLGNLSQLVAKYPWLSSLNKGVVKSALSKLSGILPALAIWILLFMVPIILNMLARIQGAQTGKALTLSVQNYYFFFSFVQVFLVVTIASGALSTIESAATNILSIPQLLATNLPRSANFFFSYLILQALSTSAGNLCQWVPLGRWYVEPRLLDTTPRQKWLRQQKQQQVNWGAFFPFYTTIACIALIYSVIAPLMILFAIITFVFLWVSNRYTMLYVIKPGHDTGGLMYPRALNQNFVGLYFLEVVLIGLFILVRDEKDRAACIPHAIIMGVFLALTAIFQVLLNIAFSPLYNFLPITFEDEAVLRDLIFEKQQAARFTDHPENEEDVKIVSKSERDQDIELKPLSRTESRPADRYGRYDPRRGATAGVNWAAHEAKRLHKKAIVPASELPNMIKRQQEKWNKDLESQRKNERRLFEYEDEIEDYTPEERNWMVDRAFHHEAVRSRMPTAWIPKDELSVSNDEIKRTTAYAMQYRISTIEQDVIDDPLRISNKGTALDSKFAVVYADNPPDFDSRELIDL